MTTVVFLGMVQPVGHARAKVAIPHTARFQGAKNDPKSRQQGTVCEQSEALDIGMLLACCQN